MTQSTKGICSLKYRDVTMAKVKPLFKIGDIGAVVNPLDVHQFILCLWPEMNDEKWLLSNGWLTLLRGPCKLMVLECQDQKRRPDPQGNQGPHSEWPRCSCPGRTCHKIVSSSFLRWITVRRGLFCLASFLGQGSNLCRCIQSAACTTCLKWQR